MDKDIAIRVSNLSKLYQIYDRPEDRLRQSVIPRLQRVINRPSKVYYREFWALKDVSFEVRKGESVGIVGRNGSGKSTLLQIICGILSPTSGEVEINGRVAALLELGSGFNPEFTGRENIYLNGALLGLEREEVDACFDDIAAFADIGAFIDQPVKTYSSGMLVRLAFAVQVQVSPDILIIDEALAVGDWLFQKRCFQRLEELVSNGTTLLFVSHDQESVRTLTSRALLLKDGNQVRWGLSSEVILEYRRLLHEEESQYFGTLIPTPPETSDQSAKITPPSDEEKAASRSDSLSFGEGSARISKVRVLNNQGDDCNMFYPGDQLLIRVYCKVFRSSENLNVAIRLRNKEGVKVYSWGTLNQDMAVNHRASGGGRFWTRSFDAGQEFVVDFSCDCPLGMNLYEIQAAVSYEAVPDYTRQQILHWIDEAAFFQVLLRRDEHFFGGINDMRMTAKWHLGEDLQQ